MIKVENYPNAYKEVYVILENMSKEDFDKIPKSFIDMIKKKMNNEYDFKMDESKSFLEQELLNETRVILAYICINFWSNKEQKEKIENKFKYDIIEWEENKEEYNPDELFSSKKSNQEEKDNNEINNNNLDNNNAKEEKQIAKYKKTGFIKTIISFIKKLFQ